MNPSNYTFQTTTMYLIPEYNIHKMYVHFTYNDNDKPVIHDITAWDNENEISIHDDLKKYPYLMERLYRRLNKKLGLE
jgi:hypothetical protein